MSHHYETLSEARLYGDVFGTAPPAEVPAPDVWPRGRGYFIRSAAAVASEAAPSAVLSEGAVEASAMPPQMDLALPARELVAAQWGLVPHWVKSASDGRLRAAKLLSAKSETVSSNRAFRDAWLQGQRCIVPMAAFFEDDLRTSKAVPTRISRVDGQPMGIAGLWAHWNGPDGDTVLSYTWLTMNANNHALLRHYQQPGSEKRMPVILNEGAYGAWLTVRVEKAKEFMRQYPAQGLVAQAAGVQAAGAQSASAAPAFGPAGVAAKGQAARSVARPGAPRAGNSFGKPDKPDTPDKPDKPDKPGEPGTGHPEGLHYARKHD